MLVDRIRSAVISLATLAFCLAVPALAHAQSTNAIITGSITDANGGVLPGVTVTAANTQTGLVRTVVTGTRGAFQLNALPPGTYKVTASLEGFAPQAKPPLT